MNIHEPMRNIYMEGMDVSVRTHLFLSFKTNLPSFLRLYKGWAVRQAGRQAGGGLQMYAYARLC